MKTNTIKTATQPWWLMGLHGGFYAGMGLVLLIHPTTASLLHALLLGGLLLAAGVCTMILGFRRKRHEQVDSWFIISGIRDSIFGVALLVEAGQPLAMIVNILGLWGIVYAFLQAIEAIFYFLGTRSDEKEDYGVEIIHAICVLVAGGFAFSLVMRPDGLQTSLGFVGLFLLVLGGLQGLLTDRLQKASLR
ncbi:MULTISPECIES: DUF308 domain-containing protein [Spirosoma]|uniref:DUF308 domain-containing protein n=1 Tax=Spirosoma pollinicola TaxID=2057025 RepID=A0A2K8Z695_9BACT|nr:MULTISPECIES: DUF308 domain-containing protein [Spirosoma]AUD05416.1 hypothetical protein CWM47_28350 [Spirosoma pollinicola]RYF78235.1 MAG: hypothetical protein EOO39_01965 [Cytophagaceae bacterium]